MMPTADDYAQWIVDNADKKWTPDFETVAQAYADTMQKPVSVKSGSALNDIGRQVGLTARYGIEGLANTAQIVTEPIRYVTDRLTGNTGKTKPLGVMASGAADAMGLPSPQGANERVVGDATRLLAGSSAMMGAGNVAAKAPGMLGKAGEFFAQAPTSQLASAAGAGLAGGASREAGGSTGQQVLSSLVGGLAGAGLAGVGGALSTQATKIKNAWMTPQQMDVKIGTVLQKTGVDYSQVPERVRQSMRAELADALKTNRDLDPAAVARLLDFQRNGLTPTRGTVSLDPVQITREQNLSKIAANSGDGALHGLPRIQNQNNAQLINRLNDFGARSEVDPIAAGRMLSGRVQGTQGALRGAEQEAWDAAKASPGYTQPIYPEGLNAINKALGDEGMMGFMSKPISEYMAAFQTGQQPFTPQAYRNLQSMLAKEMSKGGNEAAAAGIARKALEASPMRPITNPGGRDFGTTPVTAGLASALRAHDAQAGDSIQAVNRARSATRAAYQYEDSSPLVRSVLSGGSAADPVRIAKRFVIGGTPDEAATVAREVGADGLPMIKNAIATHIKRQALSGAADEVGKVSQSRLNAVIKDIGEEKLRLFFAPAEIEDLKSAARVASYMQLQPVGSAVNNSSSGALLLGRGADLLNKLPVVGPMVAPALKNIDVTMRQRQAQNVLPGLLLDKKAPPWFGGLVAPGVATGGLLAPQIDY